MTRSGWQRIPPRDVMILMWKKMEKGAVTEGTRCCQVTMLASWSKDFKISGRGWDVTVRDDAFAVGVRSAFLFVFFVVDVSNWQSIIDILDLWCRYIYYVYIYICVCVCLCVCVNVNKSIISQESSRPLVSFMLPTTCWHNPRNLLRLKPLWKVTLR